ncbi:MULTISPECIES: aldehyde dehydrogenase family protein [Rhizobium/Agrobacterium group]|nr:MULTISPECIES: aldehyde dehydrogenase family protein [Rhizobium/Agrobacterium group]MDA5636464.1 aldehyde dehydrogenase family protein [Agrobacterium sp. ST15.16.024]MDF1892320.1 aldehyde dehydrogenase family protein [Rhizobium rhizogenes]
MGFANGDHYINGEWVSDAPNGYNESINPATGEFLGPAPNGSIALAERAVTVAREVFEASSWASSPRIRAAALLEFADRMEARKDALAELLCRESGKTLAQAKGEVAAGFGEARYYAGVARNLFGRTFESAPGNLSLMTREPSGVVSVIVPWNAPVTLLVRSVAPALAAGCSVVIKPAPQTPLTNAMVMQCFAEATGFPAGVVNSVNENGIEVGNVFSTHDEIDVISFTGSTKTGSIIMANAARTIKHLSLELGGKAPAIVFQDADLDKAIAEITNGSLVLNGQMCTTISRLLVADAIYDEVKARITQAYERVVIGNPMDAGVQLGPLIDAANQRRVLDIIERACVDADSVVLRGEKGQGALGGGFFVSPSIFEVSDVKSWLVQDELFAPILTLERFSDEGDALRRGNATRFGLAASVYTQDLNRSMRMSRKLKFGTVWLNCHNRLMAEVETGGYRTSGLGRLHGMEAMNDFMETKHIYVEAGA